jgi:hypothetical protein
MFRARIGVIAAGLVAAATVVVTLAVRSTLEKAADAQVTALVASAQQAVPSLDLLRGMEQTTQVTQLAHEEEFTQVFEKAGDAQRQAAFVALQARNARLEAAGRKADLLAVVGANGHVVSRDLNINAMYDEDLKARYPAVQKALDGVASKDTWSFNGSMYRAAAAPIRAKTGVIVGALVVAYAVSAGEAARDRERTGAEVAYFLDGKVHASSWKRQGGESAEEKALAAQLFDGPKYGAEAGGGAMTKPFAVKIGAEDFLAAAGPLPGNLTKSNSGFVVLQSLSAARAPLGGVMMWLMVLGAIGLLGAIVSAVLTAYRFLMPLDSIERGVAEVINGNHEYQFEAPSQDYEGLANGLNVMMARLTGRPDPSDDELGGESGEGGAQARWGGEIAVDEASTTGQHATPENVALAQEAEDAYLQRVYDEYVAARKQTGEGTEGLVFDSFTAKLKQNAEQLTQKFNCRTVRFKVVVKNGQTTLKPVPIN